MSLITIDQGTKILFCRRRNTLKTCNLGRTASFEQLSERIVLSVTATFVPDTGVLSVCGDNQNNTIVVSRDATGHILIDGGAISVAVGAPTVANTALIQVFGQAGNNKISLDEANGAVPAAKFLRRSEGAKCLLHS